MRIQNFSILLRTREVLGKAARQGTALLQKCAWLWDMAVKKHPLTSKHTFPGRRHCTPSLLAAFLWEGVISLLHVSKSPLGDL